MNYTNLCAEPSDHAVGRSRGGLSTKIHTLVDGTGKPMVVLIGPGQAGDAPMFDPLMAHLRVTRHGPGRPRTRPKRLRADKAYSSRSIRTHLRARGITAVIPEKDDQAGHRIRRGTHGGRPPSFDAEDYKGRNVVERAFNVFKQWRGLATRYDKLATTYRGGAVLCAITIWLKDLLGDTPYGLARQWEHHDEVAKAARGRIESEVKDRHGLSVEDYLNDHAPHQQRTDSPEQELAAREANDAQRDHAEAARNAAAAAQGDLQNDTDTRHAAAEAEELWDSGDRRARLADRLMAALGGTEAGRDGVQARLAAERDQGTPPIDAVRSTKRGPQARKSTGHGQGRERGRELG